MTRSTDPPKDLFLLTRRDQIEALTSPVRLELVEAFRPNEACTVAELAERLGRAPESLYYHVKTLAKVGILVDGGKRLRGRRYETLYRTVAARIGFQPDPDSTVSVEGTLKSVAAILRLVDREFAASLRASVADGSEASRPMGRRQKARLSNADLAKVRTHLDAVEKIFSRGRSRKEGRLVSCLTVVVPL